jgi:hypothetical protein
LPDTGGLFLLIDWWAGLSPWWRYGVSIALILLSTVMWFLGKLWIWGWLVGVILLLFSGSSDSEKRGYHF